MASFRKRNTGWQVRIKRKGYPEQTKTFNTYSDATAWARLIESEIDRGAFVSRAEAENTTLGELLIRYLKEVTPHKKGYEMETYRINAWLKRPLADRFLSSIRTTDFAVWRDSRVKEGKSPNTIRLELAVISHMFNVARTEWGFESLTNLTENVRIPRLPNGRTRRVSDAEIALLIKHTESYELPFILKIAVETGMRRGEMASLEWRNIDLCARTLLLNDTKNGERRQVPLSTNCIAVLNSIPRRINGRVFGMSAHAISYAFIRVCKRTGLENLHLHDIRHEAITRLFEKGLNVMEVGSISGHKTLQMLKRYTHLKAEDLAKKLG
jgi:integrase